MMSPVQYIPGMTRCAVLQIEVGLGFFIDSTSKHICAPVAYKFIANSFFFVHPSIIDLPLLCPSHRTMATNPRFVASFDVESSDKYTSFIAGIRSRLANTKHYSHDVPVLPPADPPGTPPRRWFHVVLRTRTSTLTLAIRADNLYLEGFRSSNGAWWELTPRIIAGATHLGFGGTYRDLLGDTDKLAGVALGPQQMAEAVNALAGRTAADAGSGAKQQQAREAVVALLLMVNEAARFQTVSGFVAGLMHPRAAKNKGAITGEMKAQVNGWQDLSAALLKTDKYEEEKPNKQDKKKPEKKGPETFPAFDKMGVKTADQAAATLGILLFVAVEGGMARDKALQLFRGTPNY
ncbi:hypothetical protein CFC21_068554 [Triticum aestivum]|uniref:rRNA N-glycosylase n=3 Tax=Triticum aestivum TaxID=4565 RepID=A0A3B6KSX7_WHEAT|nr:hypothetical protein CFC21_068554 [Triticum aestivum]